MNRKLFGIAVIIVIMLSTFLISCNRTTPRYTVLYTMHLGTTSKKASQVVEAETSLQAVNKVRQSTWISCDSITINYINRHSR